MSTAPDQTSAPPVADPVGVRRYLVVVSHPTIRWAFPGSLIARLTQTMVPLALLLFAQEHLGGLGAGGAVVAVYAVTASFGFVVIGRMVDRRGPYVLVIAAVINAAGIIALVVVPAPFIWPLAAVAGVSTPPLGAAIRSVFIHSFGKPSERASALSLDTIGTEVMFIGGPALVAALVVVASPMTALLIAVVVGLVGAGLFAATAGWSKGEQIRATTRHRRLLDRGLLALAPLLLIVALQMAAVGFIEVGIIARAIELGSTSAAGVLLAVWAAGSVAGGLAFGTRDWPGGIRRQCGVLLGLTGLGFCTLLTGQNLAVLYPLMFLAGLAISPAAATLATICGLLAPAHCRTEAFTWLASATGLGGAGGYALGGVLVSQTNAGTAFLVAAAIPVLAVALVLTLPARRLSGVTGGGAEDGAFLHR